MNKIIFILLLAFNSLFAKDNYELKLYEKIINSIYPNKTVTIYASEDVVDILNHSTKILLVAKCSPNVEFLIGKNFINLPFECRDKPIFSTNYKNYKKNQNSFGAFYWRKGRPQLRFKQNALDKYNISLPDNLKKYAK
jgi:hypothetical protein